MRIQAVAFASFCLAGCTGIQSSLDPAGEEATQIATLFWWMTGISLLVWAGVVALSLWAIRVQGAENRRSQAHRLILTGAIAPVVILGALLTYGLAMLPAMMQPPPEGSLRISVQGEQWWWRFRYELPDRPAFESANSLRLPVNRPVAFELSSFDVVHSFWIPSLGGKMDLIPGRVNRLTLHPTQTGRFRGVCAEFCGRGHATMAFDVEVVTDEEFDEWVNRQTRDSIVTTIAEEPPR